MNSTKMPVERNAIIESADISNDDHGVLSAWIHLDYGGSGQGFGGYVLYLPGNFRHSTNQKNYAGLFIWRVMEIVGVEQWSELKGKTVRIRHTDDKVHAIGHIVNNDWFDPSVEFARLRENT